MSTAPTTTPVRGQRMRQRMERLRDAASRPVIQVVPSNDKMRRLLRHPHAGGFRAEGGAAWPHDRFTKRRLADGSIKREERHADEDKDERGEPHRSSSGDAA
jgi:hypothetical protein